MLRGEAGPNLRMPLAPDVESVWHEFRDRLRAFVARRVPDADVDDIVQVLFLRLHQNLPALRDAERVHAWLYSAARRAIADRYRAPMRRREVPAGGAAELEAMATVDSAPGDPDADFLVFAACLAPMVDALPAPYREAIVLADLREVRVADAARAAGVTLTAMKSRVRRGRQRLRGMLTACCDLEARRAPATCAPTGAGARVADAPADRREANKDIVRRMLDASDRGDLDAILELYAPDYVEHSPSGVRRGAAGREDLRRVLSAMLVAFPDTRHTLHDLVAEGDTVVARLSATATHTGPLFGHPPTGKAVSLSGITIYRIVEGRIAERWAEHGPGVLEQLGLAAPSDH